MASSSRALMPFSTSLDPALGEPLFEINREMNRIADEVFRSSLWPFSAARQASLTLSAPPADIEENEQELCVTVDLPGVRQSDVEVSLDGDVLTICGEKKTSRERKQENYHLIERSQGRFERRIQLPFSAQAERAEASFDNGVLTVRLQKDGRSQRGQRIEIKADSGSEQPRQLGAGQSSSGASPQSGSGSHEPQSQPQGSGNGGRQPEVGKPADGAAGQGMGGNNPTARKSPSESSRKESQPA